MSNAKLLELQVAESPHILPSEQDVRSDRTSWQLAIVTAWLFLTRREVEIQVGGRARQMHCSCADAEPLGIPFKRSREYFYKAPGWELVWGRSKNSMRPPISHPFARDWVLGSPTPSTALGTGSYRPQLAAGRAPRRFRRMANRLLTKEADPRPPHVPM